MAVGFGGGFYSRNFFSVPKPIPPLEEPTAETQARFDKENEEYAEKLKQIENWTPYVNNEYGFSFEHPKDWILEGKIFESPSSKESLSVMINTPFGIECYDTTSTDEKINIGDDFITINKLEGVKNENCDTKGSILKTARVNHLGDTIVLLFGYKENSENINKVVFDRLLSTFKFVE